MKFSLKANALKRYKDILLLFLKYNRPELAQEIGPDAILDERDLAELQTGAEPLQLADDLEKMGPTFVKIGQLLSSRADLLPESYLKALARLQDEVKPFPYSEVEEIVESQLGVRISKGFRRFDPEPIAAASLGQVHAAELRDGRSVVVKVQRPGIRKQIAEDFSVLEDIARFLDEHTKTGRRYRFSLIVEEFKNTLAHELDYEREAANMKVISENLVDFPHVRVPLPIDDYTTRDVLTMEYVHGTKITRLSPLAHLDINGSALAVELFRAYLKQVLADGIFHADPHPGNVFLTDDGRVALLDVGMVGHTTPGMQDALIKILLAISEGDSERALETVLEISETRDRFDEPEFRRRLGYLITEQRHASLEQMDIGRTLLNVNRISAETGLYVPPELTLLGKTLLQLDQVGRILDPQFDPNATVRRHVDEILAQRMQKDFTAGKVLGSVLQLKDFVGGLPTRLNRILDAVGNAELEVRVRTPDTEQLMHGFQKVANRITTGLILAALIIGAALLMQVRTRFELFGYPGLAILCFLIAGGLGLWLVLSILFQDRRDKKKTRH